MQFVLVNMSSDPAVTPEILWAVATSCELQLTNEYASHWQSAGVPITIGKATDAFTEEQCIVQVLDSFDVAGALGYHATNGTGRPDIFVGWGIIKANGGTLTDGGNSLSCCISHELLEAARDPYCSFWADIDATHQQALEIADPVEGDSYIINSIAVSNFVGPRYFSRGLGPYDHMGKLAAPFSMSIGGYAIVKDSTGVHDIFARTGNDCGMPQWKRDMKRANLASRLAKRLLLA